MAHNSDRPLDPSLLGALDVLLAERSVTRAAKRLGVTQSAISHKLRALREQLGDPLFVPGKTGLVPTERALAIAGPLRQALLDLDTATRVGASFDPAQANRTFTLSTADYGELVAVPHVVQRLENTAPGLDLRLEPPSPDLAERLADGRLDIAVAPALPMPAPILRRGLGEEGFAVLLRGGHPALRRPWHLDAYLELRHLLIAPRGAPGSAVDVALTAIGRTRRVAVRVTSFVAAPFVVARTSLCLTAPTRLIEAVLPHLDVEVRPLPLTVEPVAAYMYWHQRVDNDPAHRWLREQVVAVSRVAVAPAPARRSRARRG